jgi:zinc and cadmium transporter
MHPIATSILLGLTAAAANVFGGAIIVQRNWERRYLRYFVALGAGFMLATALVEMVPESLELRGRNAAFLILLGYLIIHFFEHTVTPHFHFGEETHKDEFIHSHKGYSVLLGLIIHTFFDGIAIASGFLVSNALGWIIFFAVFLHKIPEDAGQRTQSGNCLGRIRHPRRGHTGGRSHHGAVPPSRGCRLAAIGRCNDLRCCF